MSLLSTYSDANKAQSTLLATKYTAVADVDEDYLVLTRTATKRYAYLGMTKAAAIACAADKTALYTRKYLVLDPENTRTFVIDGTTYTIPGIAYETRCGATITVSQSNTNINAWSCEISVNETDVLAAPYNIGNVKSEFSTNAYVSARNYDE